MGEGGGGGLKVCPLLGDVCCLYVRIVWVGLGVCLLCVCVCFVSYVMYS